MSEARRQGGRDSEQLKHWNRNNTAGQSGGQPRGTGMWGFFLFFFRTKAQERANKRADKRASERANERKSEQMCERVCENGKTCEQERAGKENNNKTIKGQQEGESEAMNVVVVVVVKGQCEGESDSKAMNVVGG